MKKNDGYSRWDIARFYIAVVGATLFVIWLADFIVVEY